MPMDHGSESAFFGTPCRWLSNSQENPSKSEFANLNQLLKDDTLEVSRLGVDIDARRNKVASQLVKKLEKVLSWKALQKEKFRNLIIN